jgi:hypothetical protein
MLNKDGTVSFSLFEVLGDLNDDVVERLSRDIACDDRILESVSQQIIYGIDDAGWAGSTMGATAPVTPLEKAQRFVAKHASELAADEIDMLERRIRNKESEIQEMRAIISHMRKNGAEKHFQVAIAQVEGGQP